MNFLYLISIFLIFSCGGNPSLSPEKKQLKPKPLSKDLDGDFLTEEMEKKFNFHPQIADIPHISFSFSSYQFQGVYKTEHKTEHIDYQDQAFFTLPHYHKVLHPVIFTSKSDFQLEGPLLSGVLSPFLEKSTLTPEKLKNLTLSFVLLHKGEEKKIAKDITYPLYTWGDKISFKNLPLDPEITKFWIQNKKPIYIQIKDFQFEHPISKKNILWSQWEKTLKEKNAHITLTTESLRQSYFAHGISLEEVFHYYKKDIDLKNSPLLKKKLLPRGVVSLKTPGAKKTEQSNFQVLPSFQVQRVNGFPQGVRAPRKPKLTYLIKTEKRVNIFQIQDYTFHIPGVVPRKCQMKINKLIRNERQSLGENNFFQALGNPPYESFHRIAPDTWILKDAPQSFESESFWKILPAPNNETYSGYASDEGYTGAISSLPCIRWANFPGFPKRKKEFRETLLKFRVFPIQEHGPAHPQGE